MKKFKLFLENFLIYGVGGIIGKIIPLIMIPLIIRLMPDASYYGLSDLYNTIVSFGTTLAIMGMYDAMYRMFFENENEEYKKDLCATAFVFTVISAFIISFLMLFLKKFIAKNIFGDEAFSYLVYIATVATLVGAINSMVSAPTRMQNKRKAFVVINTIIPILSYTIAVVLLLKGFYTIALPIAALISVMISGFLFTLLNHKWFQMYRFKKEYLKPLLMIAVPLLPNFLIYWIFNASDRLVVSYFMGTEATGIYAVGAKLGHVSQLIYTAFAGGWEYFSFSTMHDKNQVEVNSKIFEYLGIISFGSSIFVFALCPFIYRVLFTGNYINGYIVSPYLFLAPLLQMLFQVASNQFLIIKKTLPNMFILLLGAMVNIVLNFKLVPILGIEGAAIATLIGYIVSNVVCVIALWKMQLMKLRKTFFIGSGITIAYVLVWRIGVIYNSKLSVILAIFSCGLLVFLYRKDLKDFIKMLRN